MQLKQDLKGLSTMAEASRERLRTLVERLAEVRATLELVLKRTPVVQRSSKS
ncbi:MAG: hypothetical protein ABI333_11860 [bacterium]